MNERAASHSEKFIVGVTGNIATGKSVVMRLAADRGVLTIDADKLVHEIMDNDTEMQAAIAVAFGPEVRRPDGRIDRDALGEIVFKDPDALRDLEGMIHPAVSDVVMQRIAETDRPIVFIEAIKLLESDLAEVCQQIWVTRCTKQRQLERLRICRGLDTPSAATRIKAQPPQEDKVAQADVVIDTNGYMIDTTTQFETAWARFPEWAKVAPPAPSGLPSALSDVKGAREPGRELADKPAAPSPVASKEKTVVSQETPTPRVRAETVATAQATAASPEERAPARPDNLEVRRARPSDIPSILLLIQKATDGAITMKRSELLLALSERSYFIGQIGVDVNTVMGCTIDSQVARVDQIFIHPIEIGITTAMAVMEEIEKSAKAHICELIVVYLGDDIPAVLRQLFEKRGYAQADKNSLPLTWQSAIEESQPEETGFVIKILRGERLGKGRAA